MDDVEVLKRRIRAHPAFQGEPADEDYWLDFLEFTLEEFGSYEFMIERLADSLERHPEKLPAYLYGSEKDRLLWDVLHALVPRLWRGGKVVFPALIKWWMDVTTGVLVKPKHGGKVVRKNTMRDLSIVAAVNGIRDVSGIPYEFDEPNFTTPHTACHVVARRLGMPYATVRSIWRKKRSIVGRARAHRLVPPPRARKRRPR